jgi:hypothetical protein
VVATGLGTVVEVGPTVGTTVGATVGATVGTTVGVTGVSDVGVTTPAELPAATCGAAGDAVARDTPTTTPVADHMTRVAGRRITT